MINNQYSLRFLGLFHDDINDIVDYISSELSNTAAARALIDGV